MSAEEKSSISDSSYLEALRYMENAEETLIKAKKEGKYFLDEKYVKTACGIAYNGVLLALDGLFRIWGVKKLKNRKSIDYYRDNIAKRDNKLLNELNTAYNVLHLDGYYDGVTNVKLVEIGFETAYGIIQKLKI